VEGVLTIGFGDLVFEPASGEATDNADDHSRYRLRLSKNVITAVIYNSVPKR
jgi:hypothetical protein